MHLYLLQVNHNNFSLYNNILYALNILIELRYLKLYLYIYIMEVIKRNGQKEEISFDKIKNRLNKWQLKNQH